MSLFRPQTARHLMIDAINETTNKQSTEGLRDYFAAAAMQGLLAADQEVGWKVNDCAKRAYAQADAMLKERERGE